MTRLVATAALLAGAVSFTACEGFGQAMTSHTDVVARAAGHELTIDQTVNLLKPHERVPAQPEVVDALSNLWIDYTLLATAAAEDSTLANVDLTSLLTPYFNQQLVFQLRDSVIVPDTALTEEQLQQLYATEQIGVEVKARHVLLRVPADATPQQRDSVMALARQIRDQARGGADFAQLAAQYSQEPGAAERGGDLGYFGRGAMVAPFEEAAFALQTGEVSDIVETAFGLHIIKVEDKKVPDYASQRDAFRAQMIERRVGEAEEKYLTDLTTRAKVEVQDGAVEIAKDLATKPETRLSRRAGNRVMVRYEGGEVTAREYLDIMRGRNAQQRTQIAGAEDDDLRQWLQLLARDEILVTEAGKYGFAANPTEQDSLRRQARQQLAQAAREAGLLPIVPQQGETQEQAIGRAVMNYLDQILKGEKPVTPLNAIGYALREKYDAEIFDRAVPEVVSKLAAARPPQQAPQGMPPMPQPQPQTPPPSGTGQ